MVRTRARSRPAAATARPSAAAPRRRYLYEADVVRLLTFLCVIAVHTVPVTTDPQSGSAGAVEMLLHFTRNAFFLLSAFVLTYVHMDRGVRLRSFWPRRFYYIGVPYVAWTLIYWWIPLGLVPSLSDLPSLGYELVTGTAMYHLYFLLVSMQLYLLFPLLLWLVRRTTGHHLALFLVSGALELVMLAGTHFPRWPGSWLTLQANVLVLSPIYQFFFVSGALAAVHYERLRGWVVTHTAAVVGIVVAAAAVQVGAYAVQLAATGSPAVAYDALQPSVVPWSLAVTLGFLALGCAYARHRRPGSRVARLADSAALVSFGVFLVHPLFLNVLLARWLAYGYSPVGPVASVLLAWGGTVLLSFAFAELAVRTPLALPLTGRRRLRATLSKEAT